jgi:hypothetical protein
MVMTLVANHVIQGPGWRAAYLVLGVPMIVVVVPLTVLTVRSRPPGAVKMTVAQGASLLEGFEAVEALHTRSFWMLVIANFCFGFVAVGTVVHLIAYLEGLGYKADSAALSMSVLFGMGGLGKMVIGHAADRIGARLALAFDFAANALAFLMVFGAAHVSVLVLFVLVGGIGAAAPVALLPMLLAESLGLRRYGILNALAGLAGTFGATAGPLVAGRIFDLTGSYINTFEFFVLLNAIGAAAALACQPYDTHAQIMVAPEPASAQLGQTVHGPNSIYSPEARGIHACAQISVIRIHRNVFGRELIDLHNSAFCHHPRTHSRSKLDLATRSAANVGYFAQLSRELFNCQTDWQRELNS